MKPRKMMRETLEYTMKRNPKFKELASAIGFKQK
jgi:hypothetical protein